VPMAGHQLGRTFHLIHSASISPSYPTSKPQLAINQGHVSGRRVSPARTGRKLNPMRKIRARPKGQALSPL
jgi:hypothetical protein